MSPPLFQPADWRRNHLLAGLPESERVRFQAQLERVELAVGQVLFEAGSTPAHVYFPITAVVSLLCITRDGASAEIAVVGNEGVVGISLFMGGNATPSRAVVQSAGQAWRLRALAMKNEAARGGPVLNLLLRYTEALIAQVAQRAVCNRYHSTEQQLCRRLLMGLDRSASDELLLTQEALSNLLGVRREGVTLAALRLQDAGVIRYSRGRIRVLDRRGLERRACECYAVARKAHGGMLPLQIAA